MRKKANLRDPCWPAWFYGPNPGEEKIFHAEYEVPEGWARKRQEAERTVPRTAYEPLNREKIINELVERGIFEASDHARATSFLKAKL